MSNVRQINIDDKILYSPFDLQEDNSNDIVK